MYPPQPFRLCAIQLAFVSALVAGEWPSDYVIQEDSTSPDGSYALIVRSLEVAIEHEGDDNPVFLADAKKHITLQEVQNVNYFQRQNHRALKAHWAPDSTWCVVQDHARFGFESVLLFELKEDGFTQTAIGNQIKKSLDQTIAKQARNSEKGAEVSPYFRTLSDRILRVRAAATTNPKELEDIKSYYAHFSGTYDLKSKRWTSIKANPVGQEELFDLESAYEDDFDKYMIVAADPKGCSRRFLRLRVPF